MNFVAILARTVVLRRETVKSAKNTISDTCAQNSRRYEFSDFFAYKVLINSKTVKSAKNTISDNCEHNSMS